jgi:hypothetical protein
MKKKIGFIVFFVIYVLVTANANPSGIVGPLIQTKWDQWSPYNSMVPKEGKKLSATGCETTAIAQIMKYHEHPVRGIGQSESYTLDWPTFEVPSVSFEVNYDWENMLNTYGNKNSDPKHQRDAVATLMYHVGVSINSYYTSASTYTEDPSPAIDVLVDNFGYDRSIQLLERKCYDDTAWKGILKAQLDAGLPVLYIGRNRNSAHVFVVDGYDNTGEFHINWGWGGEYDGWYSLDKLKPGEGILNYNYDQKMIINIKPDEGSVSSDEMALEESTQGI